MRAKRHVISLFAVATCFAAFNVVARAQDRLKSMPGYEQYQAMSRAIPNSVKVGALNITWKDDGTSFKYQRDLKRFRYDIASRTSIDITSSDRPLNNRGGRGGRGGGVPRGRQVPSVLSPDGKLKAFYRDRNLWLSDASGAIEMPITTDGSEKARIKYATASWVYGEELEQRSAMWWSPDGSKIAFYRFDESKVPDYFLQLNQTRLQDTLDVEAYPRPGDPNPLVDLLVYDLHSKSTMRIDVRDRKPFEDSSIGHYVYNVTWSKNGELLFYRSNRLQNAMEFVAADPQSGACRVILREEWPASWVVNSPTMQFLKDGKRFIWSSERTGWKNFYLYDLSGKLLATLTDHSCEVENIVHVDEDAGLLYYTAHSGDNPMKLQLHRVGLDGKDDLCLTDPRFYHTISMSPDAHYFTDSAQTHDQPPVVRLMDTKGNAVADIATSDTSKFDELHLRKVELFTFKAADGQTDLYGMLHFPSNFDAAKKYPLLVNVYGGPATNGAHETFTLPSALTEYGYLVATLDSRSAAGRGKHFLDAIYRKLGRVEIDDQAAGVKSLWDRPYVDRERVGIYGTSYGGYASAMCLVRYPDVFRAASASSPVTDFRNYDSIYTERFMGLLPDARDDYDATSVMNHVGNLKGRLILFYGTADNNVHPSNTLQLVAALQRAGKSFDLQVGPDGGHGPLRQERMMEFFIENLVLTAR
ncbi:MAG TPA: DPP IV N-terminal domain-containing protein [Humisphaera sp.]|jgi:dipeptidyl-peptidase-4|nr:DPP IV N-terminal domain-containing protein [Humisphaera sp.]